MRFLVEMSDALTAHGAAAHRVEEAMTTCAARLGTEAEFFVTPTAVFSSIGGEQHGQTRLSRVEPGEPNLSLLVEVDAVLQAVSSREMPPAVGVERTLALRAEPLRYPAWIRAVCIGLTSGCGGVFFGGGWREIEVSVLLGLLLGILALTAMRLRRVARVVEFSAGFVAAAMAGLAATFWPVHEQTVILSGLIVFLPGLTLTIAVTELATRNLVSGSARLVGAATILACLAFGVAVGRAAVTAGGGGGSPLVQAVAAPPWMLWVALVVGPFALAVLFNARGRDFPAILFAAISGFIVARVVGRAIGPEMGVCAGAFAVGVISNARAIWRNLPAGVTLVPGIMLLVPGGIGFRSLSAFMEKRAVDGIETAFLAVIVAVALVIGLLMANVVLPPRRAL